MADLFLTKDFKNDAYLRSLLIKNNVIISIIDGSVINIKTGKVFRDINHWTSIHLSDTQKKDHILILQTI